MYRHNVLVALVSVLYLSALLGCAQKPTTWTPNYRDTDLLDFIQDVQLATGKAFVIDPRVAGKVTMTSGTPLDGEQFYQLLRRVLAQNGFVAMEANNIVRIFPAEN